MELVINFVLKHKKFFIWLAVGLVVWQIWLYYKQLQFAKAAGRAFGEGAKGTATGLASIVTAPARIVAEVFADAWDFMTADAPSPTVEGPVLSYAPNSFEDKLWAGSAPPPAYNPDISANPMFRP